MPHTFISYVREDAATAEYLAALLQANGIESWIDTQRLGVGQRWKDELRRAIQEGDRFIALFSAARAARDRSVAHEELLIAIEELRLRPRDRAWFLPVKLDGEPISDHPIGGAENLRDIQYLDVTARGWATVLRDLLQAHEIERPAFEIGDPLAPGFGDSADIVGGRMVMRDFQPAVGMGAYEGSVFQITGGLCGRRQDGTIFAHFQTFAPNEALQAINEKLDFVDVEAVSTDRTISLDRRAPTRFTFTKQHRVPAGEAMELPGLPAMALPFDLPITTSFVARAWLDGNVLNATFEADWLVEVQARQFRMTGSGDVQIEVRPRIGPPIGDEARNEKT